jgi:SAM-dependent methyltransferase
LPPARRLRVRPVRASALASWVRESEGTIGTFVDVGCGTGTDAFWFARRGTPAVGIDFKPSHYRVMAGRAQREDLPLSFVWANLNELRAVLVTGAEAARLPGPRIMMARHVADALDPTGREHLLRLAQMVVGGSGRLYLQVLRSPVEEESSEPRRTSARRVSTGPADVEALVEEIGRRRGRVEARHDLVESAADGPHGSEPSEASREVTRLVVTWQR